MARTREGQMLPLAKVEMRKLGKWRGICFLMCLFLAVGCARNEDEGENAQDFPEHYTFRTDRVCMDCDVEAGEEFRNREVPEWKVTGYFYPDFQKIYDTYLANEKILETHVSQNGTWKEMEEGYYLMENGAAVSTGSTFYYAGSMTENYVQAGILSTENLKEFQEGNLEFATADKAVEAVKKELSDLDYPVEKLEFHTYAAASEKLQNIQKSRSAEGRPFSDELYEWRKEDDAYVVWARQVFHNMPVLDETKSMGGMLMNDDPNGMVVQAICSVRGIEFILVENVYLYELEETGKTLHLKGFEDIIKTVSDKYDSILTESQFEIKKIKLYQRVFRDERQEYCAEPVWYFEISENGQDSRVTLVNALDGREIILNEYM